MGAEFADVYPLVRGARGEGRVALPVHVKGRGLVERKLLLTLA